MSHFQHSLPNGLTLLAEPMDFVRSVTFYLAVPGGAAHDPAAHPGCGTVLTGLLDRGAGAYDSRALSAAFDALGIDRGQSIDTNNQWVTASTLSRNSKQALELVADLVLRPHLPDDELEPVVALCLQDIQSLEDSPQDKVMLELRKRYYPAPLNADKLGTVEGLTSLTPEIIRQHYHKVFRPNKAIISVAGNFDWPTLKGEVERLFGDWQPGENLEFKPEAHKPKSEYLHKETQQTQVAMAFPSAAITQPGYYAARGAVSVLSGGMSARLFSEVREKRGLCYSVYATHETFKDRGAVVGYAGTRAERAQETLDVMLAEFRKLKEGVTDDEIDRVKAGLKSSLIMRQESPGSRAGSLAADFCLLGRVRTFDEVKSSIDGLTPKIVQDYANDYGFADPTVVTLGPAELKW